MQEWPDLVQASVVKVAEKETANIQQLRSNVSGWADDVQAAVVKLTEKETADIQQLRSNISEWADEVPQTLPGEDL